MKFGKPIVIASHRRSGTHLAIDLLRRQFRECRSWKLPGERLDRLYLNLNLLVDGLIDVRVANRILSRVERPIIKAHGIPWFGLEMSPNKKFIERLLARSDVYYVLRDGRDVLCSLHAYKMGFDSRARCSLSQFIRMQDDGISLARSWAMQVKKWIMEPGVRIIRYEDLVSDTQAMLKQLGQELNIKSLNAEPLLPKPHKNIWSSRMARILGGCPGATNILGRYQGKHPERWRISFSREDREFFCQEAGDILVSLGYEISDVWVNGGYTKE